MGLGEREGGGYGPLNHGHSFLTSGEDMSRYGGSSAWSGRGGICPRETTRRERLVWEELQVSVGIGNIYSLVSV